MKKPKVFLSHSKKDQNFIKQLAIDLRSARIDVWYDDWEIPPGASLRSKIFEDGISECDLFFIYLTQNSKDSYWIRQELDAAFVCDVEKSGGFIAIFSDSDETRQCLSLDLRSRRIPTMDSESYSKCLLELAAISWEALLRKKIEECHENNNISNLELEKKIAEQELELTKLRIAGGITRDDILQELEGTNLEIDNFRIKLIDIFRYLSEKLARGSTATAIQGQILKLYGLKYNQLWELERDLESEILGKFVILGLVRVQPPVGEWSEIFYLTDLGKEMAFELRSEASKDH